MQDEPNNQQKKKIQSGAWLAFIALALRVAPQMAHESDPAVEA